jgi:hypothetical protein
MPDQKSTDESITAPPSGDGQPTARSRKKAAPVVRDVGPQSKGPRLQRLRAVLLLLESTAPYQCGDTVTWVGVEFQGDVFESTASRETSEEYHEENKNYAPTTSFTMNSEEITNSLVAFVDCWISKGCSKHVRFGFYCPNNYTQENKTARTTALGVEWPEGPVLESLQKKAFDDPKVLDAAKRSVLDAYSKQAEQHGNPTAKGTFSVALANFETIKQWDANQWKDFFGQIEWKFGEDDATSIEKTVFNAVQASPYFNEQLAHKEHIVVSLLLDLLDKRQAFSDPTQRVIHVAEVALKFKEVETGAVRLTDPAWQMWEAIPSPTDTRNLAGKVNAVCPTVIPNDVSRWSRRAAHSLIEQRELPDDKQVLAMKYQIYEACEGKLSQLMKARTTTSLSAIEVEAAFTDLMDTANKRVEDCLKQHHYRLKSSASIESMVFELFDSCYLSFDGGSAA